MNNDYPLFAHWYSTLDWILSAVERFPKNARFSLASRTADCGLEVMECIVEAIYSRNRSYLLDKANLSLEKLRVFFRISHDRRYISSGQYEHVMTAIDEAGRMAGGWKRHGQENR